MKKLENLNNIHLTNTRADIRTKREPNWSEIGQANGHLDLLPMHPIVWFKSTITKPTLPYSNLNFEANLGHGWACFYTIYYFHLSNTFSVRIFLSWLSLEDFSPRRCCKLSEYWGALCHPSASKITLLKNPISCRKLIMKISPIWQL